MPSAAIGLEMALFPPPQKVAAVVTPMMTQRRRRAEAWRTKMTWLHGEGEDEPSAGGVWVGRLRRAG